MEHIRKVCHLAEELLIKGELLSWRKFRLYPISIADMQIAPICNRQSDRIVVNKIIASSIVDSYPGEDSTIYIVEVLAAVSKASPAYHQCESIFEDSEPMIVINDSCYSYEQSVTFTIHDFNGSFILSDVMF